MIVVEAGGGGGGTGEGVRVASQPFEARTSVLLLKLSQLEGEARQLMQGQRWKGFPEAGMRRQLCIGPSPPVSVIRGNTYESARSAMPTRRNISAAAAAQ